MRIAAIVVGLVLLTGWVSAPADENTAPSEEKARVQESAERVLELARKYAFYSDSEKRNRLELQSQSLLAYSNPVEGEVYGNVYVWTDRGRPEVLGAIFDFRSANRIDSEFHLLSSPAIVGYREGKLFLDPRESGVEFRPVPGAPAPAASTGGRLRQMREMVRDFSVERDHPEQKREFMRLLTQPIYRYSSPAHEIVDGGLFVFVEGTDPEVFLLFEATGNEQPVWRYALARMNLVEFWGRHKEEIVWHVAPTDWGTVFEKHQPYAIVRESPRRGFDRSH